MHAMRRDKGEMKGERFMGKKLHGNFTILIMRSFHAGLILFH
jgi:hypothetical protein